MNAVSLHELAICYVLQQKRHARHLIVLGKFPIESIKPAGIVRTIIRRQLHTQQQYPGVVFLCDFYYRGKVFLNFGFGRKSSAASVVFLKISLRDIP